MPSIRDERVIVLRSLLDGTIDLHAATSRTGTSPGSFAEAAVLSLGTTPASRHFRAPPSLDVTLSDYFERVGGSIEMAVRDVGLCRVAIEAHRQRPQNELRRALSDAFVRSAVVGICTLFDADPRAASITRALRLMEEKANSAEPPVLDRRFEAPAIFEQITTRRLSDLSDRMALLALVHSFAERLLSAETRNRLEQARRARDKLFAHSDIDAAEMRLGLDDLAALNTLAVTFEGIAFRLLLSQPRLEPDGSYIFERWARESAAELQSILSQD